MVEYCPVRSGVLRCGPVRLLVRPVYHSENGTVQMTNSNASLESTVFGGESRITEQLEHIDVVTSGFKVSLITGHLCPFMSLLSRNAVTGHV